MSTNYKEQGYGCMGLSAFYCSKSTPEEKSIAVLQHAYNSGIRLFNSGDEI